MTQHGLSNATCLIFAKDSLCFEMHAKWNVALIEPQVITRKFSHHHYDPIFPYICICHNIYVYHTCIHTRIYTYAYICTYNPQDQNAHRDPKKFTLHLRI